MHLTTAATFMCVACTALQAGESGRQALQVGLLPLLFRQSEAGFVAAAAAGQFRFSSGGAASIVLPAHAGGLTPAFVTMTPVGADPSAGPQEAGRSPHPVHFLLGNDPRLWQTVSACDRIRYRDLYPGVDLVYYGNQKELEYDFVVGPGASYSQIRLEFSGAQRLSIDTHGDLILETGGRQIRQRAPQIHQISGGERQEVAGRFVQTGPFEIAFDIGTYDPDLPLVIDPLLNYGTYLGGAGDDRGYGIAADSSGCVYVVGETWSSSFPGWSGMPAGTSVFVTKISADGSRVLYTTYLGGALRDSASAVAVDAAGQVYITGFTESSDFPVTSGAFRTTLSGTIDGFVSKLSANGDHLIYSTFVGGSGEDHASAIAVNAAGEAYVAGYTASLDFPVTAQAAQSAFKGGFQDSFVLRLNAAGSSPIYASYLGGTGNDVAAAIAIDGAGNLYVAGQTDSSDFPLYGALAQKNRNSDAFIARFDSSGRLTYATYLGGSGAEGANAIAVDSLGAMYVAGSTYSQDFPVTPGAFQVSNHGGYDGFVAKIDSSGKKLVFGTYLGGRASDEIRAVALDAVGRVVVAGWTLSLDFPVMNPIQIAMGGGDSFVAMLDATGTVLAFSTYLGGHADDEIESMAMSSGKILLTGYALSADLPVTTGAIQPYSRGSVDAFVWRISMNWPAAISISPSSGTGSQANFTMVFRHPDGFAKMNWVQLLIPGNSGFNACWVYYWSQTNSLWLVNDTQSGALGPLIPGANASVENSQCILSAAGSAISGNGTDLTWTVSLRFKPAFSGARSLLLYAQDWEGWNTGWQGSGTWTSMTNQPPTAASFAPSSGTGSSGVFAATFTDANGYTDMNWVQVLIAGNTGGVGACWVYSLPGARSLYLVNDSQTAAFGPLVPGTNTTVENSQCVLEAGASSISGSGNNLFLTVSLRFKPAFSGTKTIFLYAQDAASANSFWQARGSWQVSGNQPPTVLSVTPVFGTGSSATFSAAFQDPNGFGDINLAQLLITSSGGSNACWVFRQSDNSLWLANDTQSGALGPLQPGTNTTVENSQCILNASASLVSASGAVLTQSFALSFKPAFLGPHYVFAYVQDTSGAYASWQLMSNWTVN